MLGGALRAGAGTDEVGKAGIEGLIDAGREAIEEMDGRLVPTLAQQPGHASMAKYEGDWYLCYHRLIDPSSTVLRETCISKIEFSDGKPFVNVDRWISRAVDGGDFK